MNTCGCKGNNHKTIFMSAKFCSNVVIPRVQDILFSPQIPIPPYQILIFTPNPICKYHPICPNLFHTPLYTPSSFNGNYAINCTSLGRVRSRTHSIKIFFIQVPHKPNSTNSLRLFSM
jgi:hypothetical protein